MPSSALLFIPLLAGFIFLRVTYRWRYVSRGWENSRLIFNTAVVGLVIVGVSRVVAVSTRNVAFAPQLRGLISQMFPGQFAPTLACSIGLAFLGGYVHQKLYPPDYCAWEYRESGDRLHVFLMEAFHAFKMVLLTLDDSKIYVGYILTPPTLDPKEKYVEVMPILSGYRDDERRLKITTNYLGVVEEITNGALGDMTRKDLRVVIPISKIIGAHLFDSDVFLKVFNQPLPVITPTPTTQTSSPSPDKT